MHNFVVLTADQVLHERRCCQSFWRFGMTATRITVSRTISIILDEWVKTDSGPFLL